MRRPSYLSVVYNPNGHLWRTLLRQRLDLLSHALLGVAQRIRRRPDAMQVGLQLAIASAQAVDGVEDALVNLAVPFKVVDDATFEVVGAFSSLGAAKTTPTNGARIWASSGRSERRRSWRLSTLRREWWATCRRQGHARNSQPRHAVARGVNRTGSEGIVIRCRVPSSTASAALQSASSGPDKPERKSCAEFMGRPHKNLFT